jgi:F-box interacting protein
LLDDPLFNGPCRIDVVGLAYHSQNNDFKILRIVCYDKLIDKESIVWSNKSFDQEKLPPAEAEVYTFSTDSWREVEISVESLAGSIDSLSGAPCLFFNGALHSIAYSGDHHFVLSFDVNDEIFREIMLPQNYLLDGAYPYRKSLAVFKKSLAFMVCYEDQDDGTDKCHLWVMREYGVVESWTKTCLPVAVLNFYGCTDNGELLIKNFDEGFISYDPESLNKNDLGIRHPRWLGYTAGLMESLVLLDQVKMSFKMKISFFYKGFC